MTLWESELRPMMRQVDICYPSIYTWSQKWVDEDIVSMYGIDLTLDDYKDLCAKVFDQTHKGIEFYHGKDKKIEWFVTPYSSNGGGKRPEGWFDWILNTIKKYREPVCVWTAHHGGRTAYDDLDVGIMLGHHNGRR